MLLMFKTMIVKICQLNSVFSSSDGSEKHWKFGERLNIRVVYYQVEISETENILIVLRNTHRFVSTLSDDFNRAVRSFGNRRRCAADQKAFEFIAEGIGSDEDTVCAPSFGFFD